MAKAGRPKKGSAGLPAWFDIKKYRQIKSYGSLEWFQQLIFRKLFANMGGPEDNNMPYYEDWKALPFADPHITLSRIENAATTEPAAGFERDYAKAVKIFMRSQLNVTAKTGHGIRAITNEEIVRFYYELNNFRLGRLPHSNRLKSETTINRKKPSAAPFQGTLSRNEDIHYLRIDMSLPKNVLKRAFDDYLRSQTKTAADTNTPFFKNQDFSSWYNSGILPYLDLRLWEQDSGQTFRWASFVDALSDLSDKPISSEDAYRKTIKSLEKKLLDDTTLRVLKFQAIKEKEGNKKSGKLLLR